MAFLSIETGRRNVDNFAVRGYSGMDFRRIYADILAEFQRILG